MNLKIPMTNEYYVHTALSRWITNSNGITELALSQISAGYHISLLT
jgi:hypothetical protein